jgi:putative DNA primase/helicase
MPQVSFDDVKQQARGGWYNILTSAGIASDCLTNRRKPCPGCGGRDRFRYDDKEGNGTFFCNGGGDHIAGDGFTLIQHVTGCTPSEALQRVANILGMDSGDYRPLPKPTNPPPAPPQPSKAPTYNKAVAIWQQAQSCRDIASHPYAVKKGVSWAAGAARGRVTSRLVGNAADCLIIPMHTLDGEFCGVECINPEGTKQTFGNKGVLLLGDKENKSLPIHLVEGWADGVSAKHFFGDVLVVVVFGLGMLEKKAAEIQSYNSDSSITIWPDNDKFKKDKQK